MLHIFRLIPTYGIIADNYSTYREQTRDSTENYLMRGILFPFYKFVLLLVDMESVNLKNVIFMLTRFYFCGITFALLTKKGVC